MFIGFSGIRRGMIVFGLCLWASVAGAHDYGSGVLEHPDAPALTSSRVDVTKPAMKVTGAAARVTVRLVDETTGKPVHGLLRVSTQDGQRIELAGLLSRAAGLSPRSVGDVSYAHMDSWALLPGEAILVLPQESVRVEFLSGPNSLRRSITLHLEGADTREVQLTVAPIAAEMSDNWYAGNTHVHLQGMTLAEAERYACQTAAADGYDVVFFSYLERAESDKNYISNSFTQDDLNRFSERSGVLFGYGEEYRHNLMEHGEGYGHVMFLELDTLILPASLGYSITKATNDDHALRGGIEAAQAQDATVLWCHGTRGLEDVPSWLAGLLDVQMIFDQGSLGTYEEALYRYWNLGMKVPLATGTDWFFRDRATVYVYSEEELSREAWLRALRQGRSYISNGPLVDFTVNQQPVGANLRLERGQDSVIRAQIKGAHDFGALELVMNGKVIGASAAIRAEKGYYEANIVSTQTMSQSAWIAVRATPFTSDYDRPKSVSVGFNDYGKPLFAHTSPIYVTVAGEEIFLPEAAQSLLAKVQRDREVIETKGDFSSPETRARVLEIYDVAAKALQKRLQDK
jgi:hypothetical protein